MRSRWLFALIVLLPTAGHAQSRTPRFLLQATGGPTLVDRGYQVSVAPGFLPRPHIVVLLNLERTRIFHSRGVGARPGSTFTSIAAEVRAGAQLTDRWAPFVLSGLGVGTRVPGPGKDARQSRFGFLGGGVQVSLSERATFFSDVRLVLGSEQGEILGLMPWRFGMASHF